MHTHATIFAVRVTIHSDAPGHWWWQADGDPWIYGPYPRSDAAYAAVHGAGVRIVRHGEGEPTP